jgi:LuxR family transcriptional regulator, maltose regulon positive regulatory protein
VRAALCAAGHEPMLADAAYAVAQEPASSPWRETALWLLGEAHLLAGHLGEARAALAEASTVAAATKHHGSVIIGETHFALLAMDRGEWHEAASRLEVALAAIEENRAQDCVTSLLAFAAAARLSLHCGDLNEAHRQLARAMRARPSATYVLPYVAVRLRLQLAKVYLALADLTAGRQLVREIDDILSHRPALGTLNGEVEEFRPLLTSSAAPEAIGRSPLTAAELRLLPYLQTHLTAAAIAERLFVSRHTVRTEVKSIYRKLGVSSRNDAVQQATTIGLLGA